jgi:O-methyltransferase
LHHPILPEEPQVSAASGLQYQSDGLATVHNSGFLNEPRFKAAYDFGMAVGTDQRMNLHIEWRAWVAIWAAEQALRVAGDFVECGVNTGILSGTVAHWTGFAARPERTMWLLDTFDGMPEDQLNDSEKQIGLAQYNNGYRGKDTLTGVRAKFAPLPNVRIVPGRIPETLVEVSATKVAYLSIDMNMTLPEIAAATHFWPLLSPGGVILLDDYNWMYHVNQKQAFDAFAAERNVPILGLPTGQGIIVKPP